MFICFMSYKNSEQAYIHSVRKTVFKKYLAGMDYSKQEPFNFDHTAVCKFICQSVEYHFHIIALIIFS